MKEYRLRISYGVRDQDSALGLIVAARSRPCTPTYQSCIHLKLMTNETGLNMPNQCCNIFTPPYLFFFFFFFFFFFCFSILSLNSSTNSVSG